MALWRTLLLSAAVLGTGALYFVLRPEPAPAPPAETEAVPVAAQPAASIPSAPASAAAAAALQEYVLNVGAAGPTAPLTVRQGDVIKLTVLSPDAGDVMLHGYPTQALEVQPGVPASVEIKLGRSGRFAVHFHNDQTGAHKALGELVVRKP